MVSWLKLWCDPCLDGPVRVELTPAERGTYYDLQLLAKKIAPSGLLATPTGKPYSKKWIATRLNVDIRLVTKTVQKCTDLGLINDTEMGIFLVHFCESQSDYYRQRKYRSAIPENADPDKYVKQRYGHIVRR